MAWDEVIKFTEKGTNKLSLKAGIVYKLKLRDAEVVSGRYGEQTALHVTDLEDGNNKKIYTASQKLLKRIFIDLKVKKDQIFYIRKSGDRYETVYDVRIDEKEEQKKEKPKKKESKVVTANYPDEEEEEEETDQ